MRYLDHALSEYSKTDIYPFHMPGHKRQGLGLDNPYSIDITEIDDFDNLHHPEGILREAKERARALYGGQHCYYLVNGSTGGLLAAICAATKKRDRVLVARNCHKAVYHALSLNELGAEYLYPVITGNDLQGQVTPEQVRQSLYANPDIAAVIITSPTYEGIVSDIAGIADVCHESGVPLIVDEAHGAHLGFGAGFPKNAVQLGADAVVMSLHKTLPSFTQTALLHLNSDRIASERIERYLDILMTSSPSYLLMAGMDACIRMVSEQGGQLFARYRKLLDGFYHSIRDLKYLHVLQREDLKSEEACDWDDSKIVIFAGEMGGEKLHRILLQQYHLQMEMVSAAYVLGMTSIMDTEDGFVRLAAALHEVDAAAARAAGGGEGCNVRPQGWHTKAAGRAEAGFTARMYEKNRCRMQIYQAMELPCKEVSFDEATYRMSADYMFLYPPGIPLIVPGEEITPEFLERIRACLRDGLRVEGQANLSTERIRIVYF